MKREQMSGYLEIGFLPLGESVGYDNHPAWMIEDMELIVNCYNQAVSDTAPKTKKKR